MNNPSLINPILLYSITMRLLRVLLLGLVALMLSCTASMQPRAMVERGVRGHWAPYPVKNIVLIPFISGPGALQPYEGGIEPKGPPEEFVTSAFYEQMLSKIRSVRVLPFEDSSVRYKIVAGRSRASIHYKGDALRVCRALGAQSALLGKVVTFRKRQGGELGVSSPAFVTFRVQLLECSGGKVIWEDYFSETQRSLLGNVAEVGKFLKRRGRWITARELALEGVTTVVDRLRVFIESG